MRRLEGKWSSFAIDDVNVNYRLVEVRMTQPLARLAFDLIEPASDDGLVAWNYLDDQLKDAKVYPILRSR